MNILRVVFQFPQGIYSFQDKDTEHVETEPVWKRRLISISPLTRSLNRGKGFESANITIKIDDTEGVFKELLDDDYGRGAVYGRNVIITAYKEEKVGGNWQLTQIFRWQGKVQRVSRDENEVVTFLISDLFTELDREFPSERIDKTQYPASIEEARGQVKQWLFGKLSSVHGAVRAYNVDTNKYYLAANGDDLADAVIKNVFWRTVEIPFDRYALEIENGEAYLRYYPPDPDTDTDLPAGDVEYLSINIDTKTSTNPVVVLKEVLDYVFGTDKFFEGASAVQTEMDNRGYKFQGAFTMNDKIGDIISEFCKNFDIYAYIDAQGKLQLKVLDTNSVATLDEDKIISISETISPEGIVNDASIKYKYNFIDSKFEVEDVYKHQTSIDLYGDHTGEFTFYFVRDEDTAVDVTRRKIIQLKKPKRQVQLTIDLNDLGNVELGDVITVSHYALVGDSGKFIVVKESIDFQREVVTLYCESVNEDMDYIIRIFENFDGGEIDKPHLNVVPAGSNFTVTVTPYQYRELEYFFVDYTDRVYDTLTYTFTNVQADHVLYLVFRITKFIITATSDGHIDISPSGQVLVDNGADQTFTATAKAGYTFDYFSVDGTKVTTNPYTFTNVQANHFIKAVSKEISGDTTIYYTLTLNYDDSLGTVDPYNRHSVRIKAGESVQFTFRAYNPYYIQEIKRNGSVIYQDGSLPKRHYAWTVYIDEMTQDEIFDCTFAV